MDNKDLNAHYDGYSSCPVFVGDNKLMLIEFKYGAQPAETFSDRYQTEPNEAFFYMKKEVFPFAYFNMVPRGRWFGKNSIFKPSF
jgi:eukaryotic sulfide quinone oxidoreductase